MTQDQFFLRFGEATFANYKVYLHLAINYENYTPSIASEAKRLDSLCDQDLWRLISDALSLSAQVLRDLL